MSNLDPGLALPLPSALLILAIGCATVHSDLRQAEHRSAPPAASAPASSAVLPVAIQASAAPTVDYEPEAYQPIDLSQLPNLSWPPRGIKIEPGAAACKRFRQPLGKTCSSDGDPREALVAIGKRIQTREGLKGNAAAPGRQQELERLSQELYGLEGCALAPGLVRLLRAQWLPQCAEELSASALERSDPAIVPEIRLSLYGEALGAVCSRIPQPMPPYRGQFEQRKFTDFVQNTAKPWEARNLAALQVCGDAIKTLPAGSYGRLAALRGYARAMRRLATLYRATPIDATMKRDYEVRTRYYGTLDDTLTSGWDRLAEILPEYGHLLLSHGNYGHTPDVLSFNDSFARDSPLSRLGLPAVPHSLATIEQRIAYYIPQPAVRFLLSNELFRQADVLRALVHQGLDLAARASIQRWIATLQPSDPARREVHGVLAQMLVRIGLVSRQRDAFIRAELELKFAGSSSEHRLLAALAQTLSSLNTDTITRSPQQHFLTWPRLDASPLDPKKLPLYESQQLARIAELDHIYLGNIGIPDSYEVNRKLYSLAQSTQLPEPERRCLWDFLGLCTLGVLRVRDAPPGPDPRCDCVPWPWRAEESVEHDSPH